MIDLDQARRRAKELLTAAKSGDADALGRLTVTHDPLRLADAQLAVARELGFTSWPRLVQSAQRFVPTHYEQVDWRRVKRVTVVPFLPGGDVVLVEQAERLSLPTGRIESGEDALLDTVMRVPLVTVGFRRQATHLLATTTDGRHAAFWVEGARYHGRRAHNRDASWWTGPAGDAAQLLHDQDDVAQSGLVDLADQARQALTDEQYFTDNQRLLETAYLAAPTPQGGSGFGGSLDEWREARSIICDAIDRDVTFLDVGCANGLLMESTVDWCGTKGLRVEPHGVDMSPALVDLARRRLPRWADRIWVGNALTWRPPGGQNFEVVHALLDLVPERRHRDLIDHLIEATVASGGRLLVSHYGYEDPNHSAEATVVRLGYRVAGMTRPPMRGGRPAGSPSVWVTRD